MSTDNTNTKPPPNENDKNKAQPDEPPSSTTASSFPSSKNIKNNDQICPYLDTINRTLLDFDFEHSCSITLQSNPHIYGCLICGKFFHGKGRHTPAYTHSVDTNHAVYVHLAKGTFHCLPDDYIISNNKDVASLKDISAALHPLFTKEEIGNLDDGEKNTGLARDLFGRRYLPGFVGLNNLNSTDYVNVVVQALAHVKPIRDFFLGYKGPNGPPSEILVKSKKKSGKTKKKYVNHHEFSNLAQVFGELVRKMWSCRRFKSTVDPHMLVQAVSVASKKKYHIGKQVDVAEFLSWFLHQLHVGVKRGGSNVIHDTFQGVVEVTTIQRRRRRRRRKKGRKRKRAEMGEENKEGEDSDEEEEDEDDRIGSDEELSDHEENKEDDIFAMPKDDEIPKTYIEETSTTTTTNFLQLTLDIPEKPLFKDDNGGLVIPQEPLVSVLKKFDGVSFSDALATSSNNETSTTEAGMTLKRKRYRLKQLPPYLILHLKRFVKNNFTVEKNPTIVIFPVKNLDLNSYVFPDEDEKKKLPTKEEVRKMSVKDLKKLLIQHNQSDLANQHYTEKSELIETVLNFISTSLPDLLTNKYDLVANITHNTPAEVGKEGIRRNPLDDGYYKCHVQHVASGQWYEMQDLHVQETMPQLIGLSESYVLIFERKGLRSSSLPSSFNNDSKKKVALKKENGGLKKEEE